MSIEIVRQVKAELVAAGVNLSGPCGAFAITSRVAWRLRADGWGLVYKRPEQNGCTAHGERYGVDVIARQDGTWVDILVNAETDNEPAWNVSLGIDPTLWRAPFDPDEENRPRPAPQLSNDPVLQAIKGFETELLLMWKLLEDVHQRQDRVLAGGNRPFSTLKLRPEEP